MFNSYVFKPVTPFVKSLANNEVITIFGRGPAAIAIVRSVEDEFCLLVVANFQPYTVGAWDWVGSTSNPTGYCIASYRDYSDYDNEGRVHHGMDKAQHLVWDTWLNLTHTHEDIVARRKVRKAHERALQKKRLMSDLGEDFYAFGKHPSTLTQNDRLERVYNLLWEVQAREDLPVDVKLWAMERIDTIIESEVECYEEPEVNAGSDQPSSDFPDWDDLDNGLEVRLSKAYAQQHGYAD